ncbi:MAG TPA: hypothetical protein PKC39_13180 [Ferruginibacter sp.]|nr:hypothetical protein [Ferruginibacter sp.]HMP21906.1 hypothetical protein [Ferruginibacter sp.]
MQFIHKIAALIFATVFLGTTAIGQLLSGTWEGAVNSGAYLKLHIVHTGDTCFGFRHDDIIKGKNKVVLFGLYNSATGMLNGRAAKLGDLSGEDDIYNFSLSYTINNSEEYLIGNTAPESMDAGLLSIRGMFMLLKKSMTEEKNEKEKKTKDTLVVHQPVASLTEAEKDTAVIKKLSRHTAIQKTISVKADAVKILLKDDGEVDGDIITVFDNGKIIVHKLLLTATPYEINLDLPPDGKRHLIEIVAENEGLVPPNTAYVLVIAGEERVEVKTSADRLSNAAVIIQREE